MEIDKETILKNITEGILVQNEVGKIIFANDAAARIMGVNCGEILLKSKNNLKMHRLEAHNWHGQTVNFAHFPSQTALKYGKSSSMALSYRIPGRATNRWVLFKAQPVKDDKGRVQMVISFIEDITDQIASQQQRELFLGVAGHELRTPIMSIKAFSQLARRKPKESYFDKIDEQANRLSRIINDILDVTKIRADKFELRKSLVSVDDLIKKVIANLKPVYPQYKIKAVLKAKTGVMIDPDRIAQAINNLAVNAIKYSPGSREILIESLANKKWVTVSVTDYGTGIPKNRLKHLFTTYYRIKTAANDNVEGLGLGLYITSSIIKAHAGKVSVKSRRGKGSTFTLSLPLGDQANLKAPKPS